MIPNGTSGGGRTAYTHADENGRYLLRFGFHRKRPKLVPAMKVTFSSVQSGKFHLPTGQRPPAHFASTAKLIDDPLAEINAERAIYPGQPVEINFVLQPITRLRIEWVDANEETVKGSLKLAYQTGDPPRAATTALRQINSGLYYLSFLPPRNGELELQFGENEPIKTDSVEFLKPGDYRIKITGTGEDGKPQLKILESP